MRVKSRDTVVRSAGDAFQGSCTVSRHRRDVCTIYLIKNAVNGKCYVGQTWTTATHRLREHIYAALSRTKRCIKLARAILKYGQTAFTIDVLSTAASQEKADLLEDHYIVELNTITHGYNIRRGGSHGAHSAESRRKMTTAKKGKVFFTAETREKLSKALIGRNKGPLSEETKKKLKAAQLGKKHSIEVRERMSATRVGKTLSETHRTGISEGKKAFWAALSPEDRRELTSRGVAAMASMSPEQLKARGRKILEARRRNRTMNPKLEDLRVIMRAAELRAWNVAMTLRAIGRALAEEGHLSKNNTVLKSNSVTRLLSRANDIKQYKQSRLGETRLSAMMETLRAVER
jgi:group I intron endonuclease